MYCERGYAWHGRRKQTAQFPICFPYIFIDRPAELKMTDDGHLRATYNDIHVVGLRVGMNLVSLNAWFLDRWEIQ